MECTVLFPTPVWYEDTDIDTVSLVEFSYGYRFSDPIGRRVSNYGGWHSKNVYSSIHRELLELESKILEYARVCAYEYGIGEVNLSISNLWININETGHSNSIHTHPSSFLSGVFYVMAEPGQGDIVFHRCPSQNFIIQSNGPIRENNMLNASSVSFEPKTGRLILFPSFLPHEVYSNDLEEDRISISFNIVIDNT